MNFVEPRYISLKNHPPYDERWLQERISENPSLLGLGDLNLLDRERRQPGAGRLDLLLSDPESDTRYEVELQLGATDESHLIRTIEYWDIERRIFPHYEHIAVIVAEDVTTRFLNVIGLFNQAIPLIAIQIKAVEVNSTLTLVATQVLGLTPRGTAEEDEGETVDRGFWEHRSSEESLRMCDAIIDMIKVVKPGIQAKYNRAYIGLTGPEGVQNFVTMHPRKREHLLVDFTVPQSEETEQSLDESGLDKVRYDNRRLRVRIRKADLERNRDYVQSLIQQAHDHYSGAWFDS